MPTLKATPLWALKYPVVLVGEDNPKSGRPEHALYPSPPGCAGHRLCFKILGAPRASAYLKNFLRYNLCTERWNRKEAERRAQGLGLLYRENPKILLGRKVAEAFHLGEYQTFQLLDFKGTVPPIGKILLLPHPSGRCREWNDPKNYKLAQKRLRELVHG